MQLRPNFAWILVLLLIGGAAIYAFAVPATIPPSPEPNLALASPTVSPVAASPLPSPVEIPIPLLVATPDASIPVTAAAGTPTSLLVVISSVTLLAAIVGVRMIIAGA